MLIIEAVNVMGNIDLTKKKQNIIKHRNLLSHIKMNKEILRFASTEIKNIYIFYCHKSPFFEKYVDIEELLVTNKISSKKKL